MGKSSAPDWLAVADTLRLFHAQRGPARRAFARFVVEGLHAGDPFDRMPRANFLGSESFVQTILDRFDRTSISTEVPRKLQPAKSLQQIAREATDRDKAITNAYCSGAYTLIEIARHIHAHILLTIRNLEKNGFGKVNQTWSDKNKETPEELRLRSVRKAWADMVNEMLEKNRINERVDHRSYQAQNVLRIARPCVRWDTYKRAESDRAAGRPNIVNNAFDLIAVINRHLQGNSPEDQIQVNEKMDALLALFGEASFAPNKENDDE